MKLSYPHSRPVYLIITYLHTYIQIALDRNSVFSPDVLCGRVEGGSVQCIPVTFTPSRPLAYHRRVTILVQHHTPLFVDFIGNAFTETVKPGTVVLP